MANSIPMPGFNLNVFKDHLHALYEQARRKDLEALRRVSALMEQYASGVNSEEMSTTITSAVRDVLIEMPMPNFGVKEVAEILQAKKGPFFDRESVGMVLNRLAKRGEIGLERKGVGRQPPIYTKIG